MKKEIIYLKLVPSKEKENFIYQESSVRVLEGQEISSDIRFIRLPEKLRNIISELNSCLDKKELRYVSVKRSSIKYSSVYKAMTVKNDGIIELLLPGVVPNVSNPEANKKYNNIFDLIKKDPNLNKIPNPKTDGYYISNDNWSLLVRNILKQKNTLIIGPTGSGKTSCVKEVCERIGKKLHIFDMGTMIDPSSNLLGVHRLKDGKSVFDYAKFTKVIQEPCVILLDEINRASLTSNNILFPCLDDRRTLSIDIAGEDDIREIKIHPEVTFIATANLGMNYTGTNQLDKALVNRFFLIELNHLDVNVESIILSNRTGLDMEYCNKISRISSGIRKLSNTGEISTSVSIRESLLISELVVDGFSIDKASKTVLFPLFEGSEEDCGEKEIIMKFLKTF